MNVPDLAMLPLNRKSRSLLILLSNMNAPGPVKQELPNRVKCEIPKKEEPSSSARFPKRERSRSHVDGLSLIHI
eukprot:9300434-Prorocentrum_lima.AAC.1